MKPIIKALFNCLLLIFLFGLETSLHAEAPSRSSICVLNLSLPEFRAHAFKASPLTAEIDRDYANELAAAFEVETLQNPELQVEQTFTRMEIGGANDSQSQVSLGQPLRLSHFGQRERVAELIKQSGDLDKRAKLLELSQNLNIQFATLKAYEEMLIVLDKASAKALNKIKLIHEGVKKGLLSAGDEKILEGERYRLEAQTKGVLSNQAILQNEISKSFGIVCKVTPKTSPKNEAIPSLTELLNISNQSTIGESKRISTLQDLAQEQKKLAEIDAIPQLTPRLVYQHTNDGGDFIGVGLSIPLPFWNRNQGEKMRSDAEAKVADLKNDFIINGGFQHILENLRTAAVNHHEQSEIYQDKVIPAFEAALTNQERLYTEGKGNILQVWQALRASNEVQLQGLQLWLAAINARAQLSVLVGEEI